MSFHQFLGLKHEFGADPRDGKAADCLLLAFALLDEAGVHHPPIDQNWFELGRVGMWETLAMEWQKQTVELDGPEPWAVALHWNRPRLNHPRLGISTVVENESNLGIVVVNAKKGVVWLPLNTPGLRPFSFCKFVK